MIYSDSGMYIETERLAAFGENTARGLSPRGSCDGREASRRLKKQMAELKTRYAESSHLSEDLPTPGHIRWLLDNHHLIYKEGRAALAAFNDAKDLRGGENEPVILSLCAALLRSGDGHTDPERCLVFLTGFQRYLTLNRCELDIFPCALRGAVIARLAELYSSQTQALRAEELAGRLFTTLRLIGSVDFSQVLEQADRVEQTLRLDPAGIYPLMAEDTRGDYRRRVADLAKKHSLPEYRVAEKALSLARDASDSRLRHVGYFLYTRPLGAREKKSTGGWYIASVILSSLFFTLLSGFLLESIWAAVLLLLPISETVKSILDFFLSKYIRPVRVPRMEMKDGIPISGRTLCVITTVLTSSGQCAQLARKLEHFRLANRDAGENLLFGILADLPESDKKTNPGEELLLKKAAGAVDSLNAKYGGGFYFLTRPREFSQADKKYRGRERKRGAIDALAHMLRGGESSLQCISGSLLGLRGIKYILTLDSDTLLLPETAGKLVGAMLHPLNRPVISKRHRMVVSGHGIIHPRMACDLPGKGQSRFFTLFAPFGGVDPYGGSGGEVYMDLFSCGGFAGKGIIDVDAYLECVPHRIPENRVLSHDTLEGTFLRGGFMGDVELCDDFPHSAGAYFRRSHRWIRGDWQNLPWLFRRGKGLSDIQRWRIFDSIRRSLVPPFVFFALITGFFLPSAPFGPCAVLAAVLYCHRFFLSLIATALRRDSSARAYHSLPLGGVHRDLARASAELLFLPFEAFICLSAIFSSLWRMAFSKKGLLAWQVAAPGAGRTGLLADFALMWPSVASGLMCLIFARSVMGHTAGLLWLVSPSVFHSLDRSRDTKAKSTPGDRAWLLARAREIWRFFSEFAGPADHFLPPDNWQAQPLTGTAHRTSPTNIGLCLVSALAAAELGIATRHEALGLIENTLATVRRLSKWNGHLYNWYDTLTLRPLEPKYISTVDSGNFAACLITLARWLEQARRPDLADHCCSLLSEMSFRPLYDSSRRLFRIGIEADTGKPSDSWYDLMSSEARLTSYLAVARGDVPMRHWRTLSRAMVRSGSYRGMASWTGTMFEYLMPEIFLPVFDGSLLCENARFCVDVQKKRTGSHYPWGISESAFFSLDPALSYRYKAHGCARLALKQGMDSELVISPYSTFLALAVTPKSAVKNLRLLEKIGMLGPYGFWEAVDFTPGRADAGGSVVQCVMSHHLGMSLLSVCNFLCQGKIQKLFMSDSSMGSFSSLLRERIPQGGALTRRTGAGTEAPPRAPGVSWERHGTFRGEFPPECCVLSNGAYSIMLTDSGLSRALCGNVLPYTAADVPDSLSGGMALRLDCRGRSVSLLPAFPGENAEAFWDFHGNKTVHRLCTPGFSSEVTTLVPAAVTGELRRLRVKSRPGENERFRAEFSFVPVLANDKDYVNHPAFWRLGLQFVEENGRLFIRRLSRSGSPEMWLCVCASREVKFSFDPPGPRPSRGGSALWQSQPHVTVSADFAQGEVCELSLALCLEATKQAALGGAVRILREGEANASALPDVLASLLGMSGSDVSASMALIPFLDFPPALRTHAHDSGKDQSALWRFGISGDLPIICASITPDLPADVPLALLRRHALLSACSRHFDLVLFAGEEDGYRREVSDSLLLHLRSLGLEAFLGARGGVHVLGDSPQSRDVLSFARAIIDTQGENPSVPHPAKFNIMLTEPNFPPQSMPEFSWGDDGEFIFYVNHTLPPRAWSNILTNGHFGALACDCGQGNMWFKNAHEGRINRWVNDPRAVSGPETLEIITATGRHNLFACAGDTACRVRFEPGCAVWEKSLDGVPVRTTAFVPRGVNCRVLIIEYGGKAAVEWHTSLLMSGRESDAIHVVTSYVNQIFTARSPFFPFPDTEFCAMASETAESFTCDEYAFLRGEFDSRCGSGLLPCFAAAFPIDGRLVLVCGCDGKEKLSALTKAENALAELEATRKYWRKFLSRVRVSTPDKALDRMVNIWAPYAAMACRCLGRTSVYQSGGAFGFRDQLQDAVNLINLAPGQARAHIIACCRKQYLQGDVMHWWHELPSGDRGVRTRCSDDLLWLPWAVCEYVEKTGDASVLTAAVPYLDSPPLGEDEGDRYETANVSAVGGTIYEHCKKALEAVLDRGTGEHGLLLFGSGDWNDGMDRVGIGGKGESVWLTWFFSHVADRFARLPGSGDSVKFADLSRSAGKAADAAWDGKWYLRGYFDDGTPLGSHSSACCAIDSVAQSFSVWSPHSLPDKRALALESAEKALFDREKGILRLFAPPFEDFSPDPGYIQSYGPGFRENGGQYTHGAVWLAMALLREGKTDRGYEMLRALLPVSHEAKTYAAEPFVIAADVYSAPGHEGEAGWSWYTGSAGWFYRTALEDLLGLHLQGGKLFIRPRLPDGWQGFDCTWRTADGEDRHISVTRQGITVDGMPWDGSGL